MSKLPKELKLEEGGYYILQTPNYEDPDRKVLQNRNISECELPSPFTMDEYNAWRQKQKLDSGDENHISKHDMGGSTTCAPGIDQEMLDIIDEEFESHREEILGPPDSGDQSKDVPFSKLDD